MESSVGAEVVSMLLLLAFALPSLGAVPDPLCMRENCGPTEQCRIGEVCDKSYTCTIQPVCVARGRITLMYDWCSLGRPLLQKLSKKWKMITCSPGNSCPKSFYCKLGVEHNRNICCRSDIDDRPKPGVCPKPDSFTDRICLDTCLTDNDCPHNDKCCNTDCAKNCYKRRV